MAVNTTSVMTNNIQDAYSRKVELEFQPMRAFAQFGEKKKWSASEKDPFPSNVVKFLIYNNLNPSVAVMDETTDPTSKSLSNSFATVTMYEYGDTVSTSKKLRLTSFDGFGKVATLVANSMAVVVDLIARDAYDAETGSDYVTYIGQTSKAAITSTDTITPIEAKKATTKLINKRVPGYNTTTGQLAMLNNANYYIGIIHPDVLYDFQAVTDSGGWLLPQEYANADSLYNFEAGKWGGVRYIASDLATVSYDAGAGNATDINNGNLTVGSTVISVTDATGIAAGNTMSITSTVSAGDAAELGISAGSHKFTYNVASVDTNDVTNSAASPALTVEVILIVMPVSFQRRVRE